MFIVAALLLAALFTAFPTCSVAAGNKVFVCYYGSWAYSRLDVEKIDSSLCTHLIYAFAKLEGNKMIAMKAENDLDWGRGAYRRFVKLKESNRNLKTLIAIGGWEEGSVKYSEMARTSDNRAEFIQSVMEFLAEHGFDGLDVDWEYPTERDGVGEDKENFVSLLAELKEAFAPKGYLLTAAVAAGKYYVDKAYDVPRVSQYLDLINVMTYDFHGAYDGYAHHNAPLNKYHMDDSRGTGPLNVKSAIEYWIQQGAPKNKLVMGLPLYGRVYTLSSPQDPNGLYSPIEGIADTLGFNEICQKQKSLGSRFKRYWVNEIEAPYAVYDTNKWLAYDDLQSIQAKVDYINKIGIRGGMVWSIESDDFTGACGLGNFPDKKNPLLKLISSGLSGGSLPPATTTKRPMVPTTKRTTTTRSSGGGGGGGGGGSGLCSNCRSVGDNVHPYSCTKILKCWGYSSRYSCAEISCPPGTGFDSANGYCNWLSQLPNCSG